MGSDILNPLFSKELYNSQEHSLIIQKKLSMHSSDVEPRRKEKRKRSSSSGSTERPYYYGDSDDAEDEGDEAFVPDHLMVLDDLDEPLEKFRGKSGREKFWPGGFVKNKEYDTRDRLMKRQNFKIDEHSPKKASMESGLTKDRFDMKKYKDRWVEDRSFEGDPHRPDIDHDIDVLALEQARNDAEISDLSTDEEQVFRSFVYNDEENLRILPKKDHKGEKDSKKKGKKTFRWGEIPDSLLKRAKNFWEASRARFKAAKEDTGSYWAKRFEDRKK